MNIKNLLVIGFSSIAASFFAQSGNVGINTTTPGTTLDVNGAITNRETIASVSANVVTVPANVSQVQLSGMATANVTINAPGAPNAGQRLVVFNNTTGGFGATLNGVTIPNGKALEFVYSNSGWRSTDGGSLGATPVNIYTADGTLSGNRTVAQGANTLAFTGTAVNAFSVAGNTLSVDAANGRLGIGTTTPNTKLTIRTSDNSFGINHTNGTVNLQSFIGSGAGWIGTTTPHDFKLESNNNARITISGNTGNVGIITTTPGTALDVDGAITNRETIAPVSANAVTVPANVSQVQLSGAATANVTITAPGAPNAGQRLVVFNNTTGGFGATLNGVTIPNGKALEFVYSNSGWRSTDGGSLGATPVNIYTADGTLSGNRTVAQGANTLAFTGTAVNAFSVAGNTLSVDAANGRLGIGTTTPDTKLTISTPDNSFGINHTNGTVSLKSFIGAGAGWIGTTTPHDFRLESNNIPRMIITGNTGNVGINTTTPTTTLDIDGTLRVRSLPLQTTLGISNILLSDTSGVVSQITNNDFINTLKVPNNIFNAEQTTSISTSLPGTGAANRVVFGTVNINTPGAGTWDSVNNTYTVAKKGIYQIVTGVKLENATSTINNYGLYITAGSGSWTYSGVSQIGNLFLLSGTYVKLLNAGDLIFCDTKTGAGTANYTQGNAFIHIIYTSL
ncbi:beta strand repeat-containing protein [Chryseobacterium viscerum]|uniref:C1q domain-containing protein n=1 Tax=Chryseobacterium viscerum TaxID=1037377 RepID=A0A316WCC6_9FLAO|nr:hypothetical protein [Chryseobacterium viscerum]PWN57993.1 hypothetical protein C1634_024955 [Chryseobacterium viscerum]